MGKGMAANLQKAGHDLVVHDLSRAAAEPFLAKSAVWANSPKQVGEQSEIVFTSLPVPADVEQVALGPNGLIEGMRPDTAFFDMSTNSVAMVRKINAAFAARRRSSAHRRGPRRRQAEACVRQTIIELYQLQKQVMAGLVPAIHGTGSSRILGA